MTSRTLRSITPLVTVALLAGAALAAAQAPPTTAHDVVAHAVARMGGEARLRAIHTMRVETTGYRNLLEQSERPEGPWIPQWEHTVELWDLDGGRWDATSTLRAGGEFTMREVVADGVAARQFGDRWLPAGTAQVQHAEDWLALTPPRVLTLALDAADLRTEPDETYQGTRQRVVSFAWNGTRVRVLVNAQTGFLTAAEVTRAYPDDPFLQIWGDVTTRLAVSFWELRDDGLFFPMQWDVTLDGRPHRAVTLTSVELNPTIADGAFGIPADQREAFATRPGLDNPTVGATGQPPIELAPGVLHIPGSWAVTLVRQSDGVVVLEAPISAGYSANVIAEVERRFPGLPVKAVVTTSDAWPHIGGVREYAARGIPIYLLDLNQPQIQRALDSRHTLHPDRLAREPRAADLRVVAGRTVIGEGDTRIELYPVRGETGERMMVAYLPAVRLLYASDLIQLSRNGPPEYAWEVAEVVRRQQLDVQTVFAMHTKPTPWRTILDIVRR
ncbi:MAG: hypothetical protein AB7O67_00565 [Vicinamibacterales bacterium]